MLKSIKIEKFTKDDVYNVRFTKNEDELQWESIRLSKNEMLDLGSEMIKFATNGDVLKCKQNKKA